MYKPMDSITAFPSLSNYFSSYELCIHLH